MGNIAFLYHYNWFNNFSSLILLLRYSFELIFFVEALFSLLPTLDLTGFLEDFFYMLFFSLEVLFSLNSDYSISNYIASNMDIPSKSSKAIIAFKLMIF